MVLNQFWALSVSSVSRVSRSVSFSFASQEELASLDGSDATLYGKANRSSRHESREFLWVLANLVEIICRYFPSKLVKGAGRVHMFARVFL